jgi:hypothetical protein
MRQRHWFVAVPPFRVSSRIIEKSSPSGAFRGHFWQSVITGGLESKFAM